MQWTSFRKSFVASGAESDVATKEQGNDDAKIVIDIHIDIDVDICILYKYIYIYVQNV